VIMEPTRIYVKSLLALIDKRDGLVKGMAHITGGGLLENVPRVLADNLTAVLKKDAWEMPYLFQWLKHAGNVDAQEMYRVFNCGIGMVVIVAREDADEATAQLRSTGETVYNLGTIEARGDGQAQTVVI
ncbi:MAG TPA: AIR synthase-related protein, partial [Zoogloea sp.]|nr:AIR synthase-related protein [Zoogloea sp.]